MKSLLFAILVAAALCAPATAPAQITCSPSGGLGTAQVQALINADSAKRVTGSITWNPGGGEGGAIVSGIIASVERNSGGTYSIIFTADQTGSPVIPTVTIGAASGGDQPWVASVFGIPGATTSFNVETFQLTIAGGVIGDPGTIQILVFQ